MRLFDLATSGIRLVACVSTPGYWGITSVARTTTQVGRNAVPSRPGPPRTQIIL